jgi:transposase InsO family protein
LVSWLDGRRDVRRPAPDLIEGDFYASHPDQIWVADITYIPTNEAGCFWPR